MLHPCRYKGWRWLVFSFRQSAAILSNRGNQIRSREPPPSRDLQTAFVREAASPAHRTPFAWTADRPDQSTGTACRAPRSEYGHGMPCPMTQRRCNETMPVPRDTTQQLLRKRMPVTRHAASDRMPHPLPRPPPCGGICGWFGCLPPMMALRSVDCRTGETRGVRF